MELNKKLLFIYLILFFIILISFSSKISDGYLSHNSPSYFLARDNFWGMNQIDEITDSGGAKWVAPHYNYGYNNSYHSRSPLNIFIPTMVTSFSGLESYDGFLASQLMITLFLIFAFFALIWNINKKIAYFSLPLMLFLYKFPFNTFITWGCQPTSYNLFFVFLTTIILYHIIKNPLNKLIIMFTILNAVGFLSHGREFLYFIFFLFILAIYLLIHKKIKIHLIIKILISLMLIVPLIFGFIPILIFSLLSKTGLTSTLNYKTVGDAIFFSDFGLIKYILILGLILSLFLLFNKKYNKFNYLTLFSGSLLLLTYAIYFGYTKGALQIRHFWPIILSPFLGLPIYYIYLRLKKYRSIIVLTICIIILVLICVIAPPKEVPKDAMMTSHIWEGVLYSQNQLDFNDSILVINGGQMRFGFFSLNKKFISVIDIYQYINSNGKLNIHQDSEFDQLKHDGNYIYNGGFDWVSLSNITIPSKKLKDFDYIFINMYTQKELQKYTQLFSQELQKESNYTKIFNTPHIIILKK
ncbi:MAG: hypothetical protein KAQ83_00100 [Nanoarchaeota archaeon]|nr:hypothetical protein [Nanoarchaeota archaeon]